jgi:hypothetical protein
MTAINYVVRITGPGVDHSVMVNSAEDFEALELIIAKMKRAMETLDERHGRIVNETADAIASQMKIGAKHEKP